MTAWEFLLQKKGDRSWLPLESPTVEILAGEYRLASRSGFINRTVDISCKYHPADQDYQPIEQSLQQNINEEGLLLVLPFTNFTEGNWQISCAIGTEFQASLEIVILPSLPTEEIPEIKLHTTHFLLDQETTLQISGTTSQAGTMQVVVMHPQNLSPLFDRSFNVPRGKFSLPIELPQVVDFLVLLGEIRWQEHPIATLTFTFPVERLRPQAPPPPPPPKPEIKLPPVKTTTMQPMAPPQEQASNGKVTVTEPDDLFEELDDIFTPIDDLFQLPTPAPPKTEEFVPPPVPIIQLQQPDNDRGNEYEAGRPILLRGIIPSQQGTWAIKLWVKDCQTRKIVDGPRWLLDWQTGSEQMQTETYISFPLGCLAVTIEAITVELGTGAQSRKFHCDYPIYLARRTK